MNEHEQNDFEQRLRKLKPKIRRDIRLEPAAGRRQLVKYLLACSCSFLLGLAVMYGVMRPSVSEGPLQAQPQLQLQPVEIEEKPTRFSDESIAARSKEPSAPATPKILAGNDYTYLSLLRKYQMP